MLVVALLAATAAAFALTQGLKLQKSPIFGTRVPLPVFSPVCGCDKDVARIAFKLRKADRIDVSIVDGDEVVRTIERGASYPKGSVEIEWDGRDDAGNVLPEGEYQPRVHLDDAHFTATLPNPIRIDVTPPVIQDVRVARTRRLSRRRRPAGPRHHHVPPQRARQRRARRQREATWAGTRFPRTEETIVWNAKARGRPVRAGVYSLQLVAFDPAGNRSARTDAIPVAVRYVALGRGRVAVDAGAPFAIRVSSDARRVRWTLGGRSGFARPGTLRLLAPLQKGQFTLTVSANGHTARAAVFVREPSR